MTTRIGDVSIDDLQAMLDEAASWAGVVGAQLSVSLDDCCVDLAYGLSNVESGEAMTAGTIGQIGSITKLLNASLVLSLVEDGLLSLDQPIAHFDSGLRLADGVEHEITLRQLLSMSAGLDNGPYSARTGEDDTLSAYIRSIADLPHPYRPGKGFGYSNAGSCLAGYLAQVVGGRPWANALRSRVLEPCGLSEWAMDADRLPFHRVSLGHQPANDDSAATVIRPWGFSVAQAPAGSTMAMSTRDLARFGRMLASGGGDVLSRATIAAMTTPTSTVPAPIPSIGIGDRWGLGPSLDRWGRNEVWSHAGGMRSARSLLSWIPSLRGVVALTLNTPACFSDFAARVLRQVCPAVFGVSPREMPNVGAAREPLADIDRFVGTYLRFGTSYELLNRAGRLRYRETNLGNGLPDEVLGVTADSDCIPLGDDKFLFNLEGFREPFPLTFSGCDGEGRATRLVSTLFPALRVYR